MARIGRWLGVWAIACGPDIAPSCAQMCRDAAVLQGGCIAEWGLDWQAVGYDDEQAFVEACEAWAWQTERLPTPGEDWTDETCRARGAAFRDAEATCMTFVDVDWNDVPTSEP